MPDLKVTLPGVDPAWLTLRVNGGECRLKVKPFTTAIAEAGRWASRRSMAALIRDGHDPVEPEVIGVGQQAFIEAVARVAVVDWEGVVGDDDRPLACTPELIAAVLGIPEFAVAFDSLYIKPYAERLAEKNASAPAPAGTSGAGPAIAEAAAPAKDAGAPPAPI